MTSIRHNTYLDAARACILDVGWKRTTLTDVARRAGVSRMTIYRTWPDMQTLLADLMTREWTGVVAAVPHTGTTPEEIAEGVVAAVRALRGNPLFRRILDVDPELVVPYLLDRRGRSQELILEVLGRADRARSGRRHRPRGRPAPAGPHRAAGRPRPRPLRPHDDRRRRHRGRPRHRARHVPRPGPDPVTDHRRPATDARIGTGLAGLPDHTDLLVIGLGVTGAGVALDAASRGLDVVAVDAHDLAFGTSRWSSKLVHGGLRYLAKGQLGVAHESAVERGILMDVTAPHLTHPMPMLLPLMSSVGHAQAGLARAGFAAGDLLRRSAGTRVGTLPHPRRITRTEVLAMAPGLRTAGLRGGLLSWDGQLEDDARLVTCIARTAVAHGARAHTRVRVLEATGDHRHPPRRAHRRDPHDHAPARSSTPPASGPATSSTSTCAPAAAPTWCSAPPPSPA